MFPRLRVKDTRRGRVLRGLKAIHQANRPVNPCHQPNKRCLVYIDLNMVRAGVVSHPAQWKACGYNEIQSPRTRYRVIDLDGLCDLTASNSIGALRRSHKALIEQALARGALERHAKWTESMAVGPESFTERFQP